MVSSLTTEAIIGLNFLKEMEASVDIAKKLLYFGKKGCKFSLIESILDSPGMPVVRAMETVKIPPFSELEVLAHIEGPMGEGNWILEGISGDHSGALVARALVNPASNQVVVRLLNYQPEHVTVFEKSKIASMEKVEELDPPKTTIGSIGQEAATPEQEAVLWDMVEKLELEHNQKKIFFDLLLQYADIFAYADSDLGRTSQLNHEIHTGEADPIRQPVRRVPPHRRQEIQQLLKEMKEKDVIQQSSSPWASPIVLVRKKDGSTRFCVDYRKLNEVTRKDAYPLPRIDATLDALAGTKWFSTLDLLSGYWQVEVAEKDRPKTAFCTTEGLFEFKVMPFGLCNAPATFQRLMDLLLAGLQWSHCLVYIDDVIVLGKSFPSHLEKLSIVFDRLRTAGLKLKPSKCHFLQQKVQFLGHVVSSEGVTPDPSKIEKVADWPTPTTTKEVQQFLGLASYYRKFVKDFAELAKPLHRLTEKNAKFQWTDDCQRAFIELRQKLVTSPILVYPDFNRNFILDTDASNSGIGAVLSQLDDNGCERVIAYGSRLLSKAERQYCVTRRELLAVVFFTKQFRPYLAGKKFLLRTDHGSLTWLRNFKEPEGQLARWLEQLQELDFDIVHRQGRKHTNADALSRLPCPQCKRESHDPSSVAATMVIPSESTQKTLRDAQLEDPIIKPLLISKEAGEKPLKADERKFGSAARRLMQLWDQLIVRDGILYRQYAHPTKEKSHLQLIIPKSLRDEVLEDLHEGALGGHLGMEKMLARVKERFYWPGHHKDTQNWCRNCATCSARKNPPQKPRAPLQSIRTGYPLQMVATDILGPFPESKTGNKYILVVADYFTRWTEAYPIPNQEATTIARKLTDEFFFRFSIPEQLHSDQGRQFESEVIAEICRLLEVAKTRTTPYHPQSDGLVERFNRTLLSMLSTAAAGQPFAWEDHLRRLCMAYNTSVHPTTGYTPFALMFGRQARMPIDIMYGTPAETTDPQFHSEYATQLQQQLQTAYESVREKTGQKLERQKEFYDRKVHGKPFSVGDLVWLNSPAIPRGQFRKLYSPWTGPYKVVTVISEVTYRIENVQARRQRMVVHFDRLKACPPDMRLPTRQKTKQRKNDQEKDPLPPPPPPGTHLTVSDDVSSVPHAPSNSPPPHRYPQRNHAPPDFFMPGISH